MNGTLSPSVLVSMLSSGSGMEQEFRRQDWYSRSAPYERSASPVPRSKNAGAEVWAKVWREALIARNQMA